MEIASRDIGEKAKQNSARNNAKCSKCFQILCNNSDRTWFFNTLTLSNHLAHTSEGMFYHVADQRLNPCTAE